MPYPADSPMRGEVYWVNLDPVVGSEQAGDRPAVVISPNTRNRAMNTLVVAAITTKIRDRTSVIAPLMAAGSPLPTESAVLTFQIRTIDKLRIRRFAGTLSREQMISVARGLRASFGI